MRGGKKKARWKKIGRKKEKWQGGNKLGGRKKKGKEEIN